MYVNSLLRHHRAPHSPTEYLPPTLLHTLVTGKVHGSRVYDLLLSEAAEMLEAAKQLFASNPSLTLIGAFKMQYCNKDSAVYLRHHYSNYVKKRADQNRMVTGNKELAQNEALEEAARILAKGPDAFLAREILRQRSETSAVDVNTRTFLVRNARVQFSCPPPHHLNHWHGQFGRVVGAPIRDRLTNMTVGTIQRGRRENG